MIFHIMKKQALLLLRNPMQLLLLIGLPIILIAILGTALSSWMNGDEIDIQLKIALIEHEKEEEQVGRFLSDLEKDDFPIEAVRNIKQTVAEIAPIHLLKETVFGSEAMSEMISLEEIEPLDRNEIMEDDSYTAIIEVPENFTYDTLNAMIRKQNVHPTLEVYENEEQEIGVNIVHNILTQFQEELTLGTFLSDKGIERETIVMEEADIFGEEERVSRGNPVTSTGYYTVGMAVMNALFMATAIGTIAFYEKDTHVFDRMILANVSRWVYFAGMLITGTLFSFLQLLIVFGFAWIVFGVTWPDIYSFLVVTLSMAISVGGITALLTAISFRFHSETVINFFSSIVVTLMAFLGGSFFPIGDYSPVFQKLGNFTPNGAGMTAFLTILRGEGIGEISNHILYIIIFAVMTIIIGALSYPKRGASA